MTTLTSTPGRRLGGFSSSAALLLHSSARLQLQPTADFLRLKVSLEL